MKAKAGVAARGERVPKRPSSELVIAPLPL